MVIKKIFTVVLLVSASLSLSAMEAQKGGLKIGQGKRDTKRQQQNARQFDGRRHRGDLYDERKRTNEAAARARLAQELAQEPKVQPTVHKKTAYHKRTTRKRGPRIPRAIEDMVASALQEEPVQPSLLATPARPVEVVLIRSVLPDSSIADSMKLLAEKIDQRNALLAESSVLTRTALQNNDMMLGLQGTVYMGIANLLKVSSSTESEQATHAVTLQAMQHNLNALVYIAGQQQQTLEAFVAHKMAQQPSSSPEQKS